MSKPANTYEHAGLHVNQHGEPIGEHQQRAALADIEGRVSCIRHSLRLEHRLTERLPNGNEVIGVFAHLGEFADTANKPIPVSVQIGTVSLTPRGEATLKLAFTTLRHTATTR